MLLRLQIENADLGPARCCAAFESGYAIFGASDYAKPASVVSYFAPAFESLQASYDELELDPYMNDGGRYRFRRFGRLSLDSHTGELLALEAAPFFQALQVNPLNGGAARSFSPAQPRTLANTALHSIIRFQFAQLPLRALARRWRIHIHQIRIVGKPGETGNPTPEGIHQDGDYYVGMVLINRLNVVGGESRIYDSSKRLETELTLLHPLDSLVVDDRSVFHEVTSIAPSDPSSFAIRDMLVIEFNPEAALSR